MFALIVLVVPLGIGVKLPLYLEPPRAAAFTAPTDERTELILIAIQYRDPPVSAPKARLADKIIEFLVTP
jgi:hypothetical protein